MKLKIYDGCRDFNVSLTSINQEHIPNLEFKKLVIGEIVDTVDNEESLNDIIKYVKSHLKMTFGDYYNCEICDDSNSYEEFEL